MPGHIKRNADFLYLAFYQIPKTTALANPTQLILSLRPWWMVNKALMPFKDYVKNCHVVHVDDLTTRPSLSGTLHVGHLIMKNQRGNIN